MYFLEMPGREHINAQVLISRLGLADLRWRTEAEVRLVHMGAEAVEPLIGALRHANPVVRHAAASALARIGDARALRPLAACLGDSENRASVALSAERGLVELGARAVEALLEAAKDGSEGARPRAVRALGRIGPLVPVAPVEALLDDPSAPVRAQAVTALGHIAGEAAVSRLRGALCDSDSWVRLAAAEALVALRRGDGREALERLLASVEEDDLHTRRWVEELLQRIEELRQAGELEDI